MTERHRVLAKVEGVHLGYEDHGIFTAGLEVQYGTGSHQTIGLHCLSYSPPPERIPHLTPTFGAYIAGLMGACGVGEWNDCVGRTVWAVFESKDASNWDQPLGIEPLETEGGKPFYFADWQETAPREY